MVGKNDKPIYELEFDTRKGVPASETQLNQFIIHAALDVVDEMMWKNQTMFLKNVDQYKNNQFVSSFVCSGNVKFMLLHPPKNEDAIKAFFTEAHEYYLKILMNPFYSVNTPIESKLFDEKMKALVQKKLI
uniref:Trafficking protein particle complex subunit n=1 Tax=Arcella intermedia TaxID=1963864 RepID=A0A6B2LQC8_9EUKA